MPERPRLRRRPGVVQRLARRLRSRRAIVIDHSMEPTLSPGDRLLYDPAAYRSRPPRPGEIVLLHDPDGSGRRLVKRVAAGAGEIVRIAPDGRLAAGRAPPGAADEPGGVRVPPGHIFLVADRSDGGRDSRSFGPVQCDQLIGRAWYRYAPGDRRGPLDGP